MTEHISTCSIKSSDIIMLRTRRRNYLIKIENFAKCSEKIAQVIILPKYDSMLLLHFIV